MLTQKLQDDLNTSLKARDQNRVDTLRLLLSEIKNAQIEKHADLTDEEVITVLKKYAKKLREAYEMFEKGGRTDLAAENKAQIGVVSDYLPAAMTEADLEAAIDKLIAENRTAIDANPKVLIGLAMKALSGQAEPGQIMAVLKKKG